jgi:hypothetical protein
MYEVFFGWEDDMIFLDEFPNIEEAKAYIESDYKYIAKLNEIESVIKTVKKTFKCWGRIFEVVCSLDMMIWSIVKS